jgi:hypothetical protein
MKQQQLSPKDWQTLSEYLDGQLSPRDQGRLEQRLRENEDMRTALEELRQTRFLLRSVKMQRVPRNFTLTPAMARQAQPKPILQLIPVLNFASALAALAVIVTITVQLLPIGAPAAPSYSAGAAPAAAPMSAQTMEKAVPEATQPIIVQWNGQPNDAGQPMATGKGGGGSGPASSPLVGPDPITIPGFAIQGSQAAPAEPAPGAAMAAPAAVPTATPEAGVLTAPLAPEFAPTPAAPSAENAAPNLLPQQPALDQSQPTLEAAALPPVEGPGPILGVQPPEQAQTENRDLLQQQAQSAEESSRAAASGRITDWAVPSLLALIAAGSLLAGWLIRRNA